MAPRPVSSRRSLMPSTVFLSGSAGGAAYATPHPFQPAETVGKPVSQLTCGQVVQHQTTQRTLRPRSPMSAIGPKQTWPRALHMSAFGGKADMTFCGSPLSRSLLGVKRTWLVAAHMSAFDPKRTLDRTGALVTCARIWREIFKLIRLAFPFF